MIKIRVLTIECSGLAHAWHLLRKFYATVGTLQSFCSFHSTAAPSVMRHMHLPKLFIAFTLLAHAACALGSEESAKRFLQSQSWAGASTPREVNVLWGVVGDLNGDGVPDYAAVVDVRGEEGAEAEERLVVLAGAADESYKLISQSGTFCGAGQNGKFYYLSVNANSLFVQAVWVAEGESFSARTMQFRFNQNINDLQLIGEEEEQRDNGQDYKVSVNFLSGEVLFNRISERQHREVKAQLVKAPLLRLQSFECFSQDKLRPPIYIDEHFKVTQGEN